MKFPDGFLLAERTGLVWFFYFFLFSQGNFGDGTATNELRNGSNEELDVQVFYRRKLYFDLDN